VIPPNLAGALILSQGSKSDPNKTIKDSKSIPPILLNFYKSIKDSIMITSKPAELVSFSQGSKRDPSKTDDFHNSKKDLIVVLILLNFDKIKERFGKI